MGLALSTGGIGERRGSAAAAAGFFLLVTGLRELIQLYKHFARLTLTCQKPSPNNFIRKGVEKCTVLAGQQHFFCVSERIEKPLALASLLTV